MENEPTFDAFDEHEALKEPLEIVPKVRPNKTKT